MEKETKKVRLQRNKMRLKRNKRRRVSSEGLFQYTSPEEIENRVREMAAKKNVKLYGTKLVGFTPEEAYRRAVNALSQENATAWKCSAEYRM